MHLNPITKTDYPDPDVIRVDDTYYMISTTMYYMPGGVILKSYDLVNWEIETYLFDMLDGTASERLEGDDSNYGKGMWAACLRYHDGKYYVAFVSHGRKDTHLLVSDNIKGPWEHRLINEYFHDCSILFDDDGRVFIVSGNTEIRLTELEPDLSRVKEGGIDKIIIRDNREAVNLGYEGAHFYKINGKYYITLIHWPKYNSRRTEAVFVCDTVDGEYVGKDVIWDDMGYHNNGVAQGGLVDTPDGKWYAILFQDSGAVGRVPVLVPVVWKDELSESYSKMIKNDGCGGAIPIYGEGGMVPFNPRVKSTKPDYVYEPLFTSDDFSSQKIKKQWQWNHVPNEELWKIENNSLKIKTGKICVNPVWAQNTLTQRMMQPGCQATVTVDATGLKNGDTAGLIALEGCYGMLGIRKEEDRYFIVKLVRTKIEQPYQIGYPDREPGELLYKEEIDGPVVTLRLRADFNDMKDLLDFYVLKDGQWMQIGDSHQMRFGLDHFTGARFGLCVYSEQETGGEGSFADFVYELYYSED